MAADASLNFSLLHRTCKLVVLLCFLHISVTLVFYIRSLDTRFAFVQNQQTYNNVTQSNPVRNRVVTSQVQSEVTQKQGEATSGDQKNPDEKEEEPPKELGNCPETSPLLGKSAGRVFFTCN